MQCSAVGGEGAYTFAVYYKKTADSKWITVQNFKTNAAVALTLTNAGSYDICVKVKDNSTVAKKYLTVNVAGTQLTNTSVLSADKMQIGETVSVSCSAAGGTGSYTYAVYYKETSSSKWVTVQGFKSDTTVAFTMNNAGVYDICVKAKDGSGAVAKVYFSLSVTDGNLSNTSALSASEIQLGDSVTVSCSATGSTGAYKYAVYDRKSGDSKWTTQQNYSTVNTVTIQPAEKGTYDICVKVMDNLNNITKKYYTVIVK